MDPAKPDGARRSLASRSILELPVEEIADDRQAWLRAVADLPAETLYRHTLEIQHELTLPRVLESLRADSRWQSARTVLDLGCGPGHLLRALRTAAPHKTYVGVDRDRGFLAQAAATSGVRFVRADVMEYDDGTGYDYVFLIEIVKHLPDLDALIARLRGCLSPGGTLFVRDALEDRWVRTSPVVASAESFQQAMLAFQRAQRVNPSSLSDLERRFHDDDWDVQWAEDVSVEVSALRDLDAVLKLMVCAAELSVRFYGLAVDQWRLLCDLLLWRDSSNAAAWIDDRWVRVRYVKSQ